MGVACEYQVGVAYESVWWEWLVSVVGVTSESV